MGEKSSVIPFAGILHTAAGNNRDANGYQDFVHQNEAHKALSRAVPDTNGDGFFSGLLVIPTGGGKTFTAAEWLLKNWISRDKKVLWIAHRHELLDQAFGTFKKNCFDNLLKNKKTVRYRLISGQHDKPVHIQPEDDVLIASKDSLSYGLNYLMDNWISANAMQELFFVIDEAHHAAAKTYRKLINALREKIPNLKILGLTATPFRTAEKEEGLLKRIFPNDILHKTDLRTLISRGILAEPVFQEEKTQWKASENITEKDIENIKKFDLPESIKTLIAGQKERNNRIAEHYFQNRDQYKQLLVFALNIDHAIALNALFNERGKKHGIQSEYVISNIRDALFRINLSKENKEKLEKFRKGEIQVLVNVNIVTEGTDLPNVQTVFLTRPTISKILMTQMIGRALRGRKAGGTDQAYIVSFIDEWQDERIAWVNPEKLYIADTDFNEKTPETEKRLIRLISIEKIEEFTRIMDNTVDTNSLEALNFLDRIPVGVYAFSLLESVNGEESRDRSCEVLLYNHMQKPYSNFMDDLPDIFRRLKIDIDNTEKLEPIDMARLAMHAEATHFPNARGRLGFREEDIKDILLYYFDRQEIPPFIPFENRDQYDIDRIAQEICGKDMRKSEEKDFLDKIWNDEHYAWNALFGYDKKYFLREIEIANDKIMHGVGIFGSHSGVTPIDEKEQRKYEDMTMAQIYKADPEYHNLLKSQVYRKYTNDKGEFFCAITGFTNKSELAFEIDHIKPFSKGGKTRLENLQIVAWWKNREKGAKENAKPVKNVQENDSADPQQKSAKPQKSKSEFDLDEIYACKKDELPQLIDSYTNAAHQGKADAQYCIGWLYSFGDAGFPKDYEKAARWFRKSAEQGDIDAQVNLAIMYQQGDGVKQSFKNAVEWFQKAADQGDPDGQNYLGVLYDNGNGVPQNTAKAIELYRLAAEQGHDFAQHNLGLKYCYGGKGIQKNFEQAVYWYRKSAEQGNTAAQNQLALMYWNGEGVEQNYAKAAEWYQKSAEQGDPDGQNYLGVLYDRGDGVPQDIVKAMELYRLAAEQGHNVAQQNLGLTYYYGAKGIPKNYEQAAFWYRKSAEQGNRSAQKRLARLYAKGIGVDEDLVLAYAWFCLAYDGKNENAKEYREVKEKLSEKQLKEGQKAVEVFRKIIEDNQNTNQ